MTSPFDLNNRTIFVTGPAKGMGPAICQSLASAGAKLALAGRDQSAIRALLPTLETECIGLVCDVTDQASVSSAVSGALEAFPDARHWGLVNVAGGTGPSGKMLWEHSLEEFQEIFDVNVTGTFLTMKSWMPLMIGQGRGEIVNIGGTYGFKGVRQASAYGATKWTLRGLTKSAALEAGSFGVRVNMVSPGGVDGPRLHRQLGEAAERDGVEASAAYERFASNSALGRMSTAEDVANSVRYLLSDASRNVTGQDLLVDGGTIV